MSAHAAGLKHKLPVEVGELQKSKVPDAAAKDIVEAIHQLGDTLRKRLDEEHIPGTTRLESTVWDVYNNEARKVDTELVKDWTSSLNFLLIFAAIFAAVLTAFIIESKKMLEPDQTEFLVEMAVLYFSNAANLSSATITHPAFEPTLTAISINCLLFASLGASLLAALATVVALQWVADYDAAIIRGGSSSEDRAKRRQFRYNGVVVWRMGEVIAALPLLLYSSVILFWAGAIQWMWMLNPTVGYIVVGSTVIAVLFYASTTIIAAVYVSAPFRTPLSGGIYWLFNPTISTFLELISLSPLERVGKTLSKLFGWTSNQVQALSAVLSTARPSVRWIDNHFVPHTTSRQREEQRAQQDPNTFRLEALTWLTHRLPISADSHHRLVIFVTGMTTIHPDTVLSSGFLEAPWRQILEYLSLAYMRKIHDLNMAEEDYEGFSALLHCLNRPYFRDRILPSTNYESDPSNDRYWYQFCFQVDSKGDSQVTELELTPFLLARDVPIPSPLFKPEFEATIKLVWWRNSTEVNSLDIWEHIFGHIDTYSTDFVDSCLSLFGKWAVWRGFSNTMDLFPAILDRQMLLFLTGMLSLPTKTCHPTLFFNAPWPSILEYLSRQYMQKIINSTLTEDDYDAVGTILRYIELPHVRGRVFPSPNYEQDPLTHEYWDQCCFEANADVGSQALISETMTFLLARDVPVPSIISMHEVNSTVKLIRWRNSTETKTIHIWGEIFSHIESYSASFLESCLHLFAKSSMHYCTKLVWKTESEFPWDVVNVLSIFSTITRQALSRITTGNEILALVQAFEGWITEDTSDFSSEFKPEVIIRRPLVYGARMSMWTLAEEFRGIHNAMTLIVARTIQTTSRKIMCQWARSIAMMLWIGSGHGYVYWVHIGGQEILGRKNSTAENLWGKIGMPWSGFKEDTSYVQEIIRIVGMIQSNNSCFGPWWVVGSDWEKRCQQVIQMLTLFDNILGIKAESTMHTVLVGLICQDMQSLGTSWLTQISDDQDGSSTSSERPPLIASQDLHKQVSLIRDPCLALIGSIACRIRQPPHLTLTTGYINSHSKSLEIVYDRLCGELSVHNPPAMWHLRAALWLANVRGFDDVCRDAFKELEKLKYIQLVFQYHLPYHDRRSSSQYLLFHMHRSIVHRPVSGIGIEVSDRLIRFGGAYWDTGNSVFDPILLMLALPEARDFSYLKFNRIDLECAKRIREICNTVKKEASDFLNLLIDIIKERISTPILWPEDVGLTLECVEKVMDIPEGAVSPSLFSSLLLSLQELRIWTMNTRIISPTRTEAARDQAILHTDRIYGLLKARSTRRLVVTSDPLTSKSRIRSTIACAQSTTVTQPAPGWLSIYIPL